MDQQLHHNNNFTTQDFLIGLSIKYSTNSGKIYKNAFELAEHRLIGNLYLDGLSNVIDYTGYPYGIYERAIKLGRRSMSHYNSENWTPRLMYS